MSRKCCSKTTRNAKRKKTKAAPKNKATVESAKKKPALKKTSIPNQSTNPSLEDRIYDLLENDEFSLYHELFLALVGSDVEFEKEIATAQSLPGLTIHFPRKHLTPDEWVRVLHGIPCLSEILGASKDQSRTAMRILRILVNGVNPTTIGFSEMGGYVITFESKRYRDMNAKTLSYHHRYYFHFVQFDH